MTNFLSTASIRGEEMTNLQNLQKKLLHQGPEQLAAEELLTVFIGTVGYRGVDEASDRASKIWQYCNGSWQELAFLSPEEMKNLVGINERQVVIMKAAFEMGKRRLALENHKNVIRSSGDAYFLLKPYFLDSVKEDFYVIYLNRGNRVLKIERESSGGLSGTVVDVKLIIRRALALRATCLIVSHNHPSGNAQASEEDKILTKVIQKACNYMDMKLLDHIIYCGAEWLSFADENLL